MRITTLYIVISIFLASCSQKYNFSGEEEISSFINDEKNGYHKRRELGDKIVHVKYIPNEFLAYRELKNLNQLESSRLDSLINAYDNSLTFLLSVGPKDNEGVDIQYDGVEDMQAFKDKTLDMNFNMEEYIVLKTDLLELEPTLVSMDNIYGMKKSRDFMVVFTPANQQQSEELKKAKEIDLVLDGALFDLGISHYVFNTAEINKKLNIKI